MTTAENVLHFLKENPSFLSQHPELLPLQAGNVVNFQSLMVQKLRSDKDRSENRQRMMIDNARTNMTIQSRIHAAALRTIEARDFDELVEIIGSEVSLMLQVDVTTLIFEETPLTLQLPNTVSILPRTFLDQVMGSQESLLQSNINGDKSFFGPASRLVKSQAILRLDLGRDGPQALIAFGSRDPLLFTDTQGTELIGFFVSVVERMIYRFLYVGA
jgi:uncharacterized protein YigA (DUF484 family)